MSHFSDINLPLNYKRHCDLLRIPHLSSNSRQFNLREVLANQSNTRHRTLFPNQSNPFDNVRSQNSLKNFNSPPILKYRSNGVLTSKQDILKTRSNCGMNLINLNSSPEDYDIMLNQC